MIPQRVKLSGFLCYKDEQEIRFDGSQLWMLAGLNGSGKSSIFDAVTYALFGHHRGGSQQAHELINKDSRSLAVEFEFLLDGQVYQAKRTLRRNPKGSASGTQQISRWEHDPENGKGRWVAVADTSKKVDFDNWVREKIGLNYETFTSSVLLLQGKAEKLLDSKPSGRAEVLASIVDLERYQRLHEKADTRRRALKAQLEAVLNQVAGVPDVTDAQLGEAEDRIEAAEAARQQVAATVEKLQHLEYEAKRWGELQTRLAALRERWNQAEALVGDAANIEQAYRRLRELREVLPHIVTVQTVNSSIAESERRTGKLLAEREALTDKRTQAEHALDGARKKRLQLQKQLNDDEKKQQEVGTKLRGLAAVLAQVRLVEGQEAELARVEEEINRLPKQPEKAVQAAQQAFEQRTQLGQAVPVLERFLGQRNELAQARKRLESARQEEQQVKSRGEQAKRDHEGLKAKLEKAAEARRQADERATETRTLWQQARDLLRDCAQIEGMKVCRVCGQPLTPGHYEEERARRQRDFDNAERQYRDARTRQEAAQREEKTLGEQVTQLEQELTRLRDEYRDRKGEAGQAGKDIERHALECRQAYLALSETFRRKIAPAPADDWLTTTYPTADDFAAVRREAADLETVRRQLREATDVQERWNRLQAQATTARQTLARLRSGLPSGDLARLREEHTTFQAEETSLANSLAGTRRSLQANEAEVERIGKELNALQQQIADLNGKLNAEEVSRKGWRERIEDARRALPEAWRVLADRAGLAEQYQWKNELEELVGKGTEAKYEQLAQARIGLEPLRQEIADYESHAEKFPEEARRKPEEVAAELKEARKLLAARDGELRVAQQQKAMLENYREQRRQLRGQALELEREHNYSVLLAQLLGRDRLQRHLVRVAERQIVDYANGVLDRLSGGQLYLRLCGGDEGVGTDRALELEAYNRSTGGAPINVAFLSGSQRFRVAVSLALGIGQYASRQHRPIESVIIDEGFGCLDRQGRQVMIQELQNLRGHLHCILLVSHQEEFADAFPDGYRFELDNGSTKVSRFRR